MEPYTRVTGTVAPIDRPNVDTDQIIPAEYLKRIERTGFGQFLFKAWRLLPNGRPNRIRSRVFAPVIQIRCYAVARPAHRVESAIARKSLETPTLCHRLRRIRPHVRQFLGGRPGPGGALLRQPRSWAR